MSSAFLTFSLALNISCLLILGSVCPETAPGFYHPTMGTLEKQTVPLYRALGKVSSGYSTTLDFRLVVRNVVTVPNFGARSCQNTKAPKPLGKEWEDGRGREERNEEKKKGSRDEGMVRSQFANGKGIRNKKM